MDYCQKKISRELIYITEIALYDVIIGTKKVVCSNTIKRYQV